MRYPNRRKVLYFGLILLTSITIFGVTLGVHHVYQNANKEYAEQTLILNQTTLASAQIQYEFKRQVQEWKNILLRGRDKKQYEKYYHAFIDQFVVTQDKAEALLKYIEQSSDIRNLVRDFQTTHTSILADYQAALSIFKASDFNAQLADKRVLGIDRKPDLILEELNNLLQVIVMQKHKDNKNSFTSLENKLTVAVTFILAFLCLLLVRLTGVLLDKNLQDPVTQAGNRNLFLESIKDVINGSHSALVALIDIDDFKVINSACGNAGGNIYLLKVFEKLYKNSSRRDIICRLSGDLFGIIIFDTKTKAQSLLKLNCDEINAYEFIYEDISISLSCSSSSYWVDTKQETKGVLENILNDLQVALQVAKSNGSSHLIHYDKENAQIGWLQKQLVTVNEISRLMQSNKCVLFVQAINPIQSKILDMHYEILLRVENEKEVYGSPYLFLETAERFNLIGKVDRYVLTALVEYLLNNPSDTSVYSINLSGKTLSDPLFIDFVKELFNSSSIPTERLCFEITETEIIKNFQVASKILSCLREFDCKIYLDDFGTGMSSYSYLAKLSVDVLKIDGTFIKDIHNNLQNQSIVNSIVGLAKDMNIKTVAEFVELEEELSTIKDLQIDYAQGYLLGKPTFFYQPQNSK